MKKHDGDRPSLCDVEEKILLHYRSQLPQLTQTIIAHCKEEEGIRHIDYAPIPSKAKTIAILHQYLEIVFPGYFHEEKLDPVNLDFHIGQGVTRLFDMLSAQVINSIRHDCSRYDLSCQACIERGYRITVEVLRQIPSLRSMLAKDVQAMYEGDPAARSYDEIIFSYPGILAIAVYRLAHLLYEQQVPMLPRIMTEHAHDETGIDIHPGAHIGAHFAIDHGTGVVIGETTTIGKDVRIYQGVTLGALSLPKDAGKTMRDQKRHPSIEDGVIIYAGATILGGNTTIGQGSIIGGNVWLTESVPPGTQVLIEKPQLIFRQKRGV